MSVRITIQTYDDQAMIIGHDKTGLNLIEQYIDPHSALSVHVHREMSISVTSVPPKQSNPVAETQDAGARVVFR